MGVCMVCKIGEPPPDVNARVLVRIIRFVPNVTSYCEFPETVPK